MPSLYDVSVPVYAGLLRTLSATLTKAENHARTSGYEPDVLLTMRLYPDMWHLHRQVQQVTSLMVRGVCRHAALPIPTLDDPAVSFDALRMRIDETIAFLEGIDRNAVDAGDEREITFPAGGSQRTLTGRDYFLTFTLPNVYFHLTTAYNILRTNGVPLKKADFIP